MNNKVIIYALVILALGFGLAFFLYEDEITYAKKLPFSKDNELIAIFYLNDTVDTYNMDVVNRYFSSDELKEFEDINLEGYERYLIVPRYNMSVIVNKLAMTEDGGTMKEFVKGVEGPFFLTCNYSDIFSNVEIEFEYNGESFNYSPYISLKDGSVVTEDFVLLVE